MHRWSLAGVQRATGIAQVAQHERMTEAVVIATTTLDRRDVGARQCIVAHDDVLPESIDEYLAVERNRRCHSAELQDRLRLRPFGPRSEERRVGKECRSR